MPFYELVCIAIHYPQYAPIKDLATGLASFVKAQGGCVRSIDYQGSRVLPTIMKAHKSIDPKSLPGETRAQTQGDYWTMKFDANPPTLKQVRERLMNDPRVLRSTLLKLGVTFEDVISPKMDMTMAKRQER